MAAVLVMKRSVKSFCATPLAKQSGMNTATFVMAELNMGMATSLVPSIAAETSSFPSSSLCRVMFSMQTMALSTRLPMARPMPARDSMLVDTWPKNMKMNVTNVERGIVSVAMVEVRKFRRKLIRTRNARMAPMMPSETNPSMAPAMNSDSS